MSEINRVLGLGFDMFTISPEEANEHDYECVFHKIVPDDTPISSDGCAEPVRFGVARMYDDDMVVMCHAHFQRFATDLVEACVIIADAAALGEDVKLIINHERKEAMTTHALANTAARIKQMKEEAN